MINGSLKFIGICLAREEVDEIPGFNLLSFIGADEDGRFYRPFWTDEHGRVHEIDNAPRMRLVEFHDVRYFKKFDAVEVVFRVEVEP
jgi:hypothetical protein